MTFEKEICSRCSGTGKFSYCEVYKDTCFKCRGGKTTLTKRGSAAYQYYLENLRMPINELVVGDCIIINGRWRKVLSIEVSGNTYLNEQKNWEHYIDLVTEGYRASIFPYSKVECKRNMEDAKAKALEYQSKLGKSGKLLKKFKLSE